MPLSTSISWKNGEFATHSLSKFSKIRFVLNFDIKKIPFLKIEQELPHFLLHLLRSEERRSPQTLFLRQLQTIPILTHRRDGRRGDLLPQRLRQVERVSPILGYGKSGAGIYLPNDRGYSSSRSDRIRWGSARRHRRQSRHPQQRY